MGSILTLLGLIFFFWGVHIVSRVFEHTYLWQIKEYRWDRIKAHIKDSKVISLKSFATLAAALLVFFGLLLSQFMSCKVLYLVLPVGFGYYVYSSLTVITRILGSKLIRPKKSLRNFLIVGSVLLLLLLPILFTLLFYKSLYLPSAEEIDTSEVLQIFPGKGEDDLLIVPLETAVLVLNFLYLFVFDLATPLLVGMMVTVTRPISFLLRKKK